MGRFPSTMQAHFCSFSASVWLIGTNYTVAGLMIDYVTFDTIKQFGIYPFKWCIIQYQHLILQKRSTVFSVAICTTAKKAQQKI